MPNPIHLLGGHGMGPGQPQIVQGKVSALQPTPGAFTDPLFVIIEAFSPDEVFRIDNWPAIHGATLPAAGAEVLVIFDDFHNAICAWWNGVHS